MGALFLKYALEDYRLNFGNEELPDAIAEEDEEDEDDEVSQASTDSVPDQPLDALASDAGAGGAAAARAPELAGRSCGICSSGIVRPPYGWAHSGWRCTGRDVRRLVDDPIAHEHCTAG